MVCLCDKLPLAQRAHFEKCVLNYRTKPGGGTSL